MKTKKTITKLATAILMLAMFSTQTLAQGWTNKYLKLRTSTVHQLEDGSYWLLGDDFHSSTTSYPAKLLRISENGNIIQGFNFDSIQALTVSTINQNEELVMIGAGVHNNDFPLRRSNVLLKVGANGQKIWQKDIHVFENPTSNAIGNLTIDTTDNNGFIIGLTPYDTTLAQSIALIKRLDEDGNILWEQSYYDSVPSAFIYKIQNSKDGGFIVEISGFQTVESYRTKIFKIDGNGNFLWEYIPSFSTNYISSSIAADNSKINIYGADNTNTTNHLGQIDQNGNELWVKQYAPFPDLAKFTIAIELPDFTYAIITSIASGSAFNNTRLGFAKVDTSGNVLNYKYLATANLGISQTLAAEFKRTLDNGFIVGGFGVSQYASDYAYLIKMDSNGIVYPNSLAGRAYFDQNENCEIESLEAFLDGKTIKFSNGQDTFLVTTSLGGNYSIGLNNGTYDIEVTNLISPYWEESLCNISSITLNGQQDSVVNFAFNNLESMPYITMDGFTRPRICASNTYYLEYCNTGTTDFTGLIRVDMDTLFQIDSASINWVTQSSNTVVFLDADGLGISECKTIEIYYTVPCDLDLSGRAICINAQALSDSVISVSPLWDLSNLMLEVQQLSSEDSVEFQLKNIGSGNMNQPESLIVIEDNVIINIIPTQLNSQELISIKKPANGKAWRAIISQTPFNPKSSFATAFIEGAVANEDDLISLGFVNQFPNNTYNAFGHTFCDEIRNSYDPNQKTVFPQGLQPNNMISANTELEYMLEFQNTGNDVAYIVRIVDTLPVFVNPTTIKTGVSSHPYTFKFIEYNVIEFLFEGINLPDSATDEQGSQGFVKFKINQTPNNPVGTEIDNSVAIYFDYNLPIVTNIARVVIGEFKVEDVETSIYNEGNNIEIVSYPNPFSEYVNIIVNGANFNKLELNVYDMSGRSVEKQEVVNGNQFKLDAKRLTQSLYVFEIVSNGKIIGTGKLMSNK